MLDQPSRFITSTLIHGDFGHLLQNLGGLIIFRSILKQLGLINKYFVLVLIVILIPTSTIFAWLWEIKIIANIDYAMLGFSGVIFGLNAFLLLASIQGKRYWIGMKLGLKQNLEARQTMIVLTIIGQVWSFLPGVSLVGHEAGFLAGAMIYLF